MREPCSWDSHSHGPWSVSFIQIGVSGMYLVVANMKLVPLRFGESLWLMLLKKVFSCYRVLQILHRLPLNLCWCDEWTPKPKVGDLIRFFRIRCEGGKKGENILRRLYTFSESPIKKKVKINCSRIFSSTTWWSFLGGNTATLVPHCYPKTHSAALGRWCYVPDGCLWMT